MKTLALILVVITLTFILIGCFKKMSSAPSTSWRKHTETKSGYFFEYPSSWSAEAVPNMNGLLVMCPVVEADWQANVFFELRMDPDNRSVSKVLEDLIPNLAKQKTGFKLVTSSVTTHSSGLQSGRIEYTHNSNGTELNDCETIILLEKGNLLFVLTSTASSVKRKYQPTLQKIVDSVARL